MYIGISNTIFNKDLSNAKIVESEVRTDSNFSNQLRENVINNVKSDIYEKFGINVGIADNSFECFISGDVLYRMNTDETLREKVYSMLEDYTSPHFQMTKISLNPPVKKCTLVFDDNGDVVATLYPDVEREERNNENSDKEKGDLHLKTQYYDGVKSVHYESYQNLEDNNAILATAIVKKRLG